MSTIYQAKPLLDFIARPESGGDYNIVWGGIRPKHRPPKLLTTMTIGEVLNWQDSIDSLYMSEAAGRYQIMEDTLRGLYKSAGMSLNDLFDEAGQDKLAFALLKRRGWGDYVDGKIPASKFANNLAREWASLPVVSGPKFGRSYYAGDGLNKSHVKVDDFMHAVREAYKVPSQQKPRPVQEIPSQGIWAAIVAFILSIFKRN